MIEWFFLFLVSTIVIITLVIGIITMRKQSNLQSNSVTDQEKGAGMIVLWHGDIKSIPDGWEICRDFAGKFVVGASSSDDITKQGGSEVKQITENELPPHKHVDYGYGSDDCYGDNGCVPSVSFPYFDTGSNTGDGLQTHSVGGKKNDDGTNVTVPYNMLPPYYVLAYIKKT
jgi:hypothetical protein